MISVPPFSGGTPLTVYGMHSTEFVRKKQHERLPLDWPEAAGYILLFMNAERLHSELGPVFDEIIAGRTVKRSVHELKWGALDVTLAFAEALARHGYRQMTVAEAPVQPGERVPAFVLENGTAYFGWVFWEKFSMLRLRKLFGSVARNDRGDWVVQIPEKRRSVIYANPSEKSEMDIDTPSGF